MIDRRTFLIGALATAAAPLRLDRFTTLLDPESDVTVKTPLGELVGRKANGVKVFKGVPFAEPPVGPLRFKSPQPAKPWSGKREAFKFAKVSIQGGQSSATSSEDCLYLNVHAPEAEGLYPVFVWVHGGGNTGGSSHDDNARNFARDGVVCVTLAYRLGALGYLHLSDALGNEYADSGANGIADLIQALRWIQQNIRAFGGDPRQVTVAGESAGAKNIAALLGSPEAQGLFVQAIMESGSAQTVHTHAAANEVTDLVVKALGGDPHKLLEASSQEILHAQESASSQYRFNYPFRPTIGGRVLPRRPIDAIASGLGKDVRLLIGTNRDECRLFFGSDVAEQPIHSREVSNISVETLRAMEARYLAGLVGVATPARRGRLLTAEEYWMPSIRVMEARAYQNTITYAYRFDRSPQDRRAGDYGFSTHGSEVAFAWDSVGGNASSADKALAHKMHACWISFVKGDNPGTGVTSLWPTYKLDDRKTTMIDLNDFNVVADPNAVERVLWNGMI